MKFNSRMISFEKIFIVNNREMHKHALALFRLYNNTKPSLEFCALHFNQILTSRHTHFKCVKSNRLKVGLNALANRLFILNGQVPLNWIGGGFETFKLKCKKLFIS